MEQVQDLRGKVYNLVVVLLDRNSSTKVLNKVLDILYSVGGIEEYKHTDLKLQDENQVILATRLYTLVLSKVDSLIKSTEQEVSDDIIINALIEIYETISLYKRVI